MENIAFRKVRTSRRWWGGSRSHYEVVLDDGDAKEMVLAELDSLIDARRYPADFWACVHAADQAFERGDSSMIAWPSGASIGNGSRIAIGIGDRVTVGGGYDLEPEWLSGRESVSGHVHAWIAGQNGIPACVVLLDEPLTATGDVHGRRESRTGSYLVLQLRYSGQVWADSGTVHVELCSAEPPNVAWSDRPAGAWVESHATYTRA